MSSLPRIVGVYGGGRMGAGIAHAFLSAGSDVIVVETSTDTAAAARDRVEASLATAVEKGATGPFGTLTVSASAEDLAATELVVEAVPELADLKAQVLASVEQVAPGADIATNTSSLSVDALAGALAEPSRLVGLHFFNPVPASSLVEIVVGARPPPARRSSWGRAPTRPSSPGPSSGWPAWRRRRSPSPTRPASRRAGSA